MRGCHEGGYVKEGAMKEGSVKRGGVCEKGGTMKEPLRRSTSGR